MFDMDYFLRNHSKNNIMTPHRVEPTTMWCTQKTKNYTLPTELLIHITIRVFDCFVIQKFRPRHDTRAECQCEFYFLFVFLPWDLCCVCLKTDFKLSCYCSAVRRLAVSSHTWGSGPLQCMACTSPLGLMCFIWDVTCGK